MAAGNRSMNLSEGNIAKMILVFSMPIFLGNLFQNLYNSVDSLVVGNFVGANALAAVNACAPISNLLVGFFTGMSTGASVIFSRSFGAGDYRKLKTSIHTTVLFSLIVGLVMAGTGIIISRLLLRAVGCPADIFEMADDYLKIYIAGILFTAIYNVVSGVLRAVGDSRGPFYALVAASTVNIFLDVILVRFVGLGVIGVGIATVISQGLSVILTFRMMLKMDERYRFSFEELKIDKGILMEVIDFGLPAGVQSSLISVSNLFVHRYINSFGSVATAGAGVGQKLDRFVTMPIQSLGLAITTYVSQNIGAKKKDRIRRGILTTFTMGIISWLALGIPLMLTAEHFVGLFNRDPEVVEVGARYIRTLLPLYPLMITNQMAAGTLRGYGYSRQVMIMSLVGMIGIRQVFLYIAMNISWSLEIVFIGFPVGWFFATLFACMYAYRLKKKGALDAVFE